MTDSQQQPMFPLPSSGGDQDGRRSPSIGADGYPGVGLPTPPTAQGAGRAPSLPAKPLYLVLAAVVLLAVVALLTVVLSSRPDHDTTEATSPALTTRSPVDTTLPATDVLSTQISSAPPQPPPAPPAVGIVVGTCDEGGSCGVKQRDAPYTAAPRLHSDDLHDGLTVTVLCQTIGDVRSSAGHGTSALWYRLDNGAFVNSVYLDVRPQTVPPC